MSDGKILFTFEAGAKPDEATGKWQPVITERSTDEFSDVIEYRGIEQFDMQEDAIARANEASAVFAAQRQQTINDELSRIKGWLDLPHDEKVRRAKGLFPYGNPFGEDS